MKQLEAKHILPYAPYQIPCVVKYYLDDHEGLDLVPLSISPTLNTIGVEELLEVDGGKPLLKPLSYLKSEILVGVEKIVPNKWLQKHMYCNVFAYEGNLYIEGMTTNIYSVYDKLFEWGFDVFNLIGQNLAYDEYEFD